MLLIAAPGQGAQAPGFLIPWLDLPGVAEQVGTWSELAGCDLIRCGTKGDAEEIRDTAVAQPLLLAAALVAAGALAGPVGGPGGHDRAHPGSQEQAPQLADAAAGHSVGELAAGVISGVISADDAMRLVRVRSEAMASAAAAEPTGMTAVLGGDEQAVLASVEAHGLTAANINAAGQVVAAGTLGELAAFAASPPAGARLRQLSVAGAFHTRHMAPAVEALREAAAGVGVSDPVLALLQNRDGQVVSSGRDWMERIITQVSSPVRWDLCMRTMASIGVTAMLELPPAGTLTGIARRGLPGVRLVSLRTPDDLEAGRALVAEHANSQAPSERTD